MLKRFTDIIFTSSFFSKWRVKVALAFGAFIIVLSVVTYTQYLVNELIKREQKAIIFYSRMYENFTSAENRSEDYEFFLNDFLPTISFPIIMTDKDDEPLLYVDLVTGDSSYEEYTLNIELNPKTPVAEQRQELKDMVSDIAKQYKPIIIQSEEGIVLQKLYYKHSTLVDILRYFPIIAIIIMAAFIFVGYMAFSNIRRNEESRVWVGMAKEAAHQLGTPLSSMFAWLELLKMNKDKPEYIEETLSDMQNDIDRLSKIATRFSKIGSQQENKTVNLYEFIDRVCVYFERRLPHLGKKVEIVRDFNDKACRASINEELFEWVIENLLKNAAEAIENKSGRVSLDIQQSPKKKILIIVKDNGKGMTAKIKRQIFYPGFTTKKRGWGLGLSLTKRIIEDYHKGKIYVKESTPGKGTTFVIELPI